MIKDLGKWVEDALSSAHYNSGGSEWERRFLELYKEYEQQDKIIKKLVE